MNCLRLTNRAPLESTVCSLDTLPSKFDGSGTEVWDNSRGKSLKNHLALGQYIHPPFTLKSPVTKGTCVKTTSSQSLNMT